MNNPKEDEFNAKFRHLLDCFVFDENSLQPSYKPKYKNLDSSPSNNIFVAIDDRYRDLCSLTNLRLVILGNFIANFLGIELNFHVCSEKISDLNKLKSIYEVINFKENFEVHTQHVDMEEIAKSFVQNIDEKFKTIDIENDVIVNYSKIKNEFKLEKYDQNLKNKYLDVLSFTAKLYENFLDQKLSFCDQIITLCLNSELFQAQKIDLLLRSFTEIDNKNKTYKHKFICTGIVKIDENEPQYSELKDDFLKHYESRRKYFKHSAEQRQMMSESLCETNIQNLVLFSIVFDFFNTNHQNDIRKFKCIDFEKITIDDGQKIGEKSSFILYNCARISAILDKFNSYVDQGFFEKLKDINDLDFCVLLKTEYERKICFNFLFKCESIFDEIYHSLISNEKNAVQIRISISKLLVFVNDLMNYFSKYYSKIHIIEDPKFKHLHDTMQARIYLLRLILNLIYKILLMFNIHPLRRI